MQIQMIFCFEILCKYEYLYIRHKNISQRWLQIYYLAHMRIRFHEEIWYKWILFGLNMNTNLIRLEYEYKYYSAWIQIQKIFPISWHIYHWSHNMRTAPYYNWNCNYSSTTIIIIANCFYCAIVPLISVGQSVKGIVW